jgi:serine protease
VTRGRNPKALLVFVGGLVAACLLAIPVQTQGPGNSQGLQIGLHNGHQVVAGEVLVKLRENARLAPMSQELDVDRDQQIGDGSIRRIHSRSHNVETLLTRLSESADVEYVEPNYVLYALETTPNDTYFDLLWGLHNTGQTVNRVTGSAGADIGATQAWDVTTGSRSKVVGVVDTGIDYTHPDLDVNIWSAPASFTVNIGGVNITCVAGTHGFNAIRNTCDPMDDNGHGTHVSGTIGAWGNNNRGVVGVNWTASIMGLKFLNSQGSGTTADAIDAIEFAIQANAAGVSNVRVLSNSWGGGGFSQALLDEINKADNSDMLFPVAAGNNRSNNDRKAYYPANYDAPNIIAVAATDNKDGLASFSNYGATTVDLGAPGVYILSTYPGNQYAYMSGTSMATPHVSGAAVLILSATACNGLDTAGVKNAILNTVDPVSSLVGKTVTGGRLNVGSAISGCSGGSQPQADFSISASPQSQSVTRGSDVQYTVTVAPLNGFGGSVSLNVSGLGKGMTGTFDPGSVSGSIPSILKVATSPDTQTKTYALTITGASGAIEHSTTVKLSVKR